MKCSVVMMAFVLVSGAAAAEEQAQPEPAARKADLGLYVGAGIGRSRIAGGVPTAGTPAVSVDEHATGWTGFVGIRPTKVLGLEASYTNFGTVSRANLPDGAGNINYAVSLKARVPALYLVGYVPIVPSRFDLFAKLGNAWLKEDATSNGNYPNACVVNASATSCSPLGLASLSTSQSTSRFAYGLGMQYRVGKVGVRAEYQTVPSAPSAPRMASISLDWNF